MNDQGLRLYSQGRFEEALASFRKAIEIGPLEASLRQNEAMSLQQLGKQAEAIVSLTKAIELDPRSIKSIRTLAQMMLQTGRIDKAVPLLRRAFELEPNSYPGILQLVQALIEEGKLPEAEERVKKAIAADPKNSAGYELLGGIQKELGRFEEATGAIETAMRVNPDRKGLYLDLINCRKVSEGDRPLIDQMIEALQHGRLGEEDRIRVQFALGKAFDDLEEYEYAIRHFDKAHALCLQDLAKKRQAFDQTQCVKRFDAIIERFSKDKFDRQTAGSEERRPLFIVGMVRSGTTLVEHILSRHSEVRAGGELAFWPNNWQSLRPQGPSFDPSDVSRLEEQYLELLRAIDPASQRVTDKMPGNYIALGAIHAVFPKARVIVCRRQPLDNCVSIMTTAFRTAHNWIHSRDDIVCFYRQHERLIQHWRQTLPQESLLEVKYEELVSEPERVTREMVSFAGLEWEEACLHPEANVRAVRTPSQWQVRQPVYRNSVDRWKNYEPWLGSLRELASGTS